MDRKRFSLLLLEPGELYLEDFSSELHIKDCEKVPGRLKLCTKSLLFEPNDIHIPLYKIIFHHCTKIDANEELIRVTCQQHTTLLSEGKITPYKLHHGIETFSFCLNYVPVEHCLEQILQIERACSLPPNEENAMIAAICHSRQSRLKFDLNWLEDINETIEMEVDASKISPLMINAGRIILTSRSVYFQPFNNAECYPFLKISLKHIIQIKLRRFLQRHVGLELFCERSSVSHLYLSFESQMTRDTLHNLLLQQPAVKLPTIPQEIMTLKWQNHVISNFEYLHYLNSMADRSINDLTQYPVFPWVVSDYTSPILDLDNQNIYRDLTKPVGALNTDRLKRLHLRRTQMTEPRYLYGSHYSTPAFVLFYLIRKHPQLMLCLQNGRFDHPDRIFHCVNDVWRNVLHNMSDFKELIPEFYDPENGGDFLQNKLKLELGMRHDGHSVHDVILPPWCESAQQFVKILRDALESSYVSQHLPAWIDLIFGFKQRGEMSVEFNNVFHPVCYEGAVDLDEIKDLNERRALEVQIMEFGQIPKCIFLVPHPQRAKLTPKPFYPSIDVNQLTNYRCSVLTEHRERVTSLSCLGDIVLSASRDSVLKEFTCSSGREEKSFHVNAIGISALALLPEAVTVVIGTFDNRIIIFDLECGNILDEVRAHEDTISSLQWSDSEQLLLSASLDGSMLVWPWSRTRLITTRTTRFDHDSKITTACLNRAGKLAACGTEDGDLFVYDLALATTIFHAQQSGQSITATSITNDDNKIISCSRFGYKVYDFSTGLLVYSAFPEIHITCLAWLTDKYLLLGDTKGSIQCVDFEKLHPQCIMRTHLNDPVIELTVLSSKSIVCAQGNHVVLFTSQL